MGGGTDGAKLKFVQKQYAQNHTGKGDHLFCILTDKEPVRTFVCRELTSNKGKKYEKIYSCRKPVKQYYIYFHDGLLGGPCYLKISSYLPFECEFYFNGHNAIQLQLDKQGVYYRLKDNAFVDVDDSKALQKAAESLEGRAVFNRITHWMNIFFKFDKGKYSTRSKFLKHDWYLTQVEVSSNIVFKSARFCTSLFERILDKFQRTRLQRPLQESTSSFDHSRAPLKHSKITNHVSNAGRSDCPTALSKSSTGGLIAAQHPRPSGGSTTIMRASNTGSGETPSSSTTKPVFSSAPTRLQRSLRKQCGQGPPSTTPNRWGLKNLFSFCRPVRQRQ